MTDTPNLPNGALILLALLSLFMITVLLACVISWIALIVLALQNKNIVPKTEPRVTQPYGLLDVVVAVVLVLGVQLVGGLVIAVLQVRSQTAAVETQTLESSKLDEAGKEIFRLPILSVGETVTESELKSPQDPAPKNTSTEINNLNLPGTAAVMATAILMCFVASGYLSLRHKIPFRQTGWSVSKLGYDFVLMVGCFVLFVPFVYLCSAIVSNLSETKYDHPLLQSLINNPYNVIFAAFIAVVAAPFTEEFLFRGILQGFLEGVASRKFSLGSFLLGSDFDEQDASMQESVVDAVIVDPIQVESNELVGAESAMDDSNPFRSSVRDVQSIANSNVDVVGATTVGKSVLDAKTKIAFWPIAISGILFGLAHFEYGVSWLPLILLGVLLGAMYRHTNRLWPCIFLHMAFNSIAVYVFAIQAFYPDAKFQ